MTNLIPFWLEHCINKGHLAYDLLAKHGVTYDYKTHGNLGGLHGAQKGKYFEADPDGDFFIAQGVWYDVPSWANVVEEPTLFDILFWHPARPKAWCLLRGETDLILGERAMFEAGVHKEPLTIHETPLDYIKDQCRGVVFLDKHSLHRLQTIETIKCSNKDIAIRIKAALIELYKPKFPKVIYAEG